MKLKKITVILFACSITLSCNTTDKRDHSDFSKQIIGVWESKNLFVNIDSYKGTNETKVIDVNPLNYEEVLGLKTAIVNFRQDGSYTESYLLPDNSAKYEQHGYWFVKQDSIILAIYKPLTNQSVQKYHVSLKQDSTIFTSLMDYDGDGKEDDDFRGVSVRVDD